MNSSISKINTDIYKSGACGVQYWRVVVYHNALLQGINVIHFYHQMLTVGTGILIATSPINGPTITPLSLHFYILLFFF